MSCYFLYFHVLCHVIFCVFMYNVMLLFFDNSPSSNGWWVSQERRLSPLFSSEKSIKICQNTIILYNLYMFKLPRNGRKYVVSVFPFLFRSWQVIDYTDALGLASNYIFSIQIQQFIFLSPISSKKK